MEHARYYAIIASALIVGALSMLIKFQMNTTDLIQDLKKARLVHETLEVQLQGIRQTMTRRSGELAALKNRIAEREEEAVRVRELGEAAQRVRAEHRELEREFRATILKVRAGVTGEPLGDITLESGTVLVRPKIQKVSETEVVMAHDAGIAKVAADDLPRELSEKLRLGDPIVTGAGPPEAKPTAPAPTPVAPVAAVAPASAPATPPALTPRQGPGAEARSAILEKINRIRIQIAQNQDSADRWRVVAQGYRNRQSSGRINSWGVEAAKAEGEAAKAEWAIKQLNAQIEELTRALDSAVLGR